MPASSGNRRSARDSVQHLPLTPAVTTVRRGAHRPVAPAAAAVVETMPSRPTAGLELTSSARGVRLSRGR